MAQTPKNPQPLDQRIAIVNPDGTPTLFFTRWAQDRQRAIENTVAPDDVNAIVATAIDAWAAGRDIIAGVGLDGGGPLSADVTINLADTAVTPGTYANVTITVDQQGRITFAEAGAPPSGGGVLPVVVGIPPELVYNDDGSLVYVEIS